MQSASCVPLERILAVIDRYGEGHSPSWIQKKIPDLSKSTVYYHMTKAGYWPCFDTTGGGRGNPFTKFEDERIVSMRLGGLNPNEIARAIGRPQSSVRMRLSYLASKE